MMAPLPMLLSGGLLAGLVGLGLAVRRREQGFWLLSVVALALGGWLALERGTPAAWGLLAFMALLALAGCTVESLSERQRWTRGLVGHQDAMAAIVGSMVALFLVPGPLAMIAGTFLGVLVVRVRSARGAFIALLRDTLRTSYAMLGAAALRVLLGVVLLESLLRLMPRL